MNGPTEPAPLLLVEDDESLASLMRDELMEAGYEVTVTANAEEAWGHLQATPMLLVVSDLRLPGMDGMALLQHSRGLPQPPGFIVVTAFGSIEQAVDALKQGADDFLTKPLNFDHLRLSVHRVMESHGLRRELEHYRELVEGGDFHGIIGRSTPMAELFRTIQLIARADGPVLVSGESGTGKELVARAVHQASERRQGPFVPLNCAGIPSELLESELFGHAAGAYTGARHARPGLFEEADGGTLLLDEIGEMPMEMQAKLLRVLQDGRVRRVGDNQERHLDVRVVAATNRDLGDDVTQGRFRQDLYYRLETFAIEVPPLRERADDIDLLAAHFLELHGTRRGRRAHGFSPAALERLRHYDFPGNVRELANAVERAVAFCRGSEITLEDLPLRMRDATPPSPPTPVETSLTGAGESLPTLAEIQRRYVRLVLDRVEGNKRRAAQILDIGRRTLYRHLDREAGDDDD